jgi:serine phosphatase RsbU (regulator of sigma subunit)
MKLRVQLMIAFLLLAVVPLSAITLYAYNSSTRALRRAVAAEATRAAAEMEGRMGNVIANLSRRIDRLEEIPFPISGKEGSLESADPRVVGRLYSTLGESADLIDALEFIPAQEIAAPETAAPPEPGAPEAPRPPRPGRTPSAPTPQQFIVQIPRIAMELARDPEAGPILRAALAFIPPVGGQETARGKRTTRNKGTQDQVAELGQRAQEIARFVMKEIEASQKAEKAAAAHEKAGTTEEKVAAAAERRSVSRGLALKKQFGCELRRDGARVGHLKAHVRTEGLLHQVLSQVRRERGEIPFARDADGNLFTTDPADLPRLQELHLEAACRGAAPAGAKPNEKWVVVTHEDPSSGLTFGIARPVGESLEEIRRASARNLGAGLGLAALALFGILPISRRMTHNLSDLTRGARRLAAGDLDVRVPVRSKDELGQLAEAFNLMARDLRANQERLVEQERLRKELELCRRIQTELLPKKPLQYPFAEVQGLSIPAHELGGDFFNYFGLPGGEVALFMGDVSGKGVPAALLMANLQATLRARIPLEPDLAAFAARLDREVEESTPPEAYLTLFVCILDPARRELRWVNAGHEAPFLLRRDGSMERLDPTGRPIGLLPGGGYTERRLPVQPGDRLFLYTDGLVDAENEDGAGFGAARLESLLAHEGAASPGWRATPGNPGTLLERVERAFVEHRGRKEAADDATLLVLQVGDWVESEGPGRA